MSWYLMSWYDMSCLIGVTFQSLEHHDTLITLIIDCVSRSVGFDDVTFGTQILHVPRSHNVKPYTL